MSRCQALVPTRYNNKLCFVGDFPTKKDIEFGFPFESAYGELLFKMMIDAKLVPRECALTNVFLDAMPGGRINGICTKKKEATERAKQLGWESYHLPAVGQALYVDPYRSLELHRLRSELLAFNPNLVVALGPTALWALCGSPKIGKYRGTILESSLVPGLKVLPTYHPRTVQAEYAKKVVVIADLIKARSEREFPEIKKIPRTIYIAETCHDVFYYWKKYLKDASRVAIDIETLNHQFISMVGFADCPERALVVPFVFSITGKKGSFKNYWETFEEELEVWELLREMIQGFPSIVGQNFLYDTQYLLKHDIAPRGYDTDTMLRQHATYIELPKALDFLGSIHTNESAWKVERKRGQKISELKRDD
jgi:uracil-DNA glycosylase